MARRGPRTTRRFVPASRNWRTAFKPELVLISAGFDAHAEDPVGDLGLEVEDFEILTKELVSVAKTHAQGRIVSVLEGGYNVPILAGSVAAHLQRLGCRTGRDLAQTACDSARSERFSSWSNAIRSNDPDGI